VRVKRADAPSAVRCMPHSASVLFLDIEEEEEQSLKLALGWHMCLYSFYYKKNIGRQTAP